MRTPWTRKLCGLLGAHIINSYWGAGPGCSFVECAVGLDGENVFTEFHDTIAGLEAECKLILISMNSNQLPLPFDSEISDLR
jgi:hypothetical protein